MRVKPRPWREWHRTRNCRRWRWRRADTRRRRWQGQGITLKNRQKRHQFWGRRRCSRTFATFPTDLARERQRRWIAASTRPTIVLGANLPHFVVSGRPWRWREMRRRRRWRRRRQRPLKCVGRKMRRRDHEGRWWRRCWRVRRRRREYEGRCRRRCWRRWRRMRGSKRYWAFERERA